MPVFESDHNHHSLDRPPPAQHISTYPATQAAGHDSPSETSPSIAPLPASTYTPPTKVQPAEPSATKQVPSLARSTTPTRDDDAEDPHDFYRTHQDPFNTGSMAGLGQGAIRVEKRGQGRSAFNGQHGTTVALNGSNGNGSNGTKLPPLVSRINSSRYASSPAADRAPSNAARSSPTLTHAGKRHTSVKELANKFNDTPDEVPPVPGKPQSRSGSVSSNPASQPSKSRASSRSKALDDSSARKAWAPGSMSGTPSQSQTPPRSRLRQGKARENGGASPGTAAFSRPGPLPPVESEPLEAQSMSNLAQAMETLPRRPLFGEVLGETSHRPDPGYGISDAPPRNGLANVMHDPNPMFTDGKQAADIDSDPFISGKNKGDESLSHQHDAPLPVLRPRPPERSHSDYSADRSHSPKSKMYDNIGSRSVTPEPTDTNNHHAHSRIPVSTRRLSTASDTSASLPSTRANSALGARGATSPAASVKSPTRSSPAKKRGPPPRLSHNPCSPPRPSRSSTPKSPRRIDQISSTERGSSTSLNAYISAPNPAKSPPLRNSRSRMPVSCASTSSSRAKMVERVSEPLLRTTEPEGRPRKIKELGSINIQQRRENIHRSLTKKFSDEDRREKEEVLRRASMIRAGPPPIDVLNSSEGFTSNPENAATRSESRNPEGGPALSDLAVRPGDTETKKAERDLKIDTVQLSERSMLDLEDSPTLGSFARYSLNARLGDDTPLTDAAPYSAVTAGTSDSVDTFFDDEPQEDLQDESERHSRNQTVLRQVMNMRESRSASPASLEANRHVEGGDVGQERDDRGSIQIMLGSTPILSSFKENSYDSDRKDPPSGADPESRWSMTSWTSSSRSRDEREAPMERIDEYSPVKTPSRPEAPAHLSVSTSASERTPQLWSPDSITSAKTARTTMASMESDAYSTINHVLDQYHDSELLNSGVTGDGQQQQQQQQLFNTQSPVLARQGGWDPKKVTQLYMQQVARERAAASTSQPQSEPVPAMPETLNLQLTKRTSSLALPPDATEKEVRDDMDEKIVHRTEHTRNVSSSSALSLTLPDVDRSNPARASLNGPEDWEMSPSLAGYDYQALDSPTTDAPPVLPPKDDADWSLSRKPDATVPTIAQDKNRLSKPASRPELPPIEGLGLKINVEPPQHTEFSIKPPPPLPPNSPPPPPAPVASQPPVSQPRMKKPASSSYEHGRSAANVYQHHATLEKARSAVPITMDGIPRPPPRDPNPSLYNVPNSSSTLFNQDRPGVDGPAADGKVASGSASPTPDEKRLKTRNHIIKELVDTEHSFLQDMKVVDDIYRGTSEIIIISLEDVKTLFGNSDQIITFSTNFLDSLKQASKPVYVLPKAKRYKSGKSKQDNRTSGQTDHSLDTTDDQSSIYTGPELSDDDKDRKTFVGEAFGAHMNEMEKVYTEYLKNHDSATKKLQVLQKNPKVQIWLKECRSYAHDLTAAWDLDSLLVKPVQRILKYPLLLDGLLNTTPENHPDYTAIDIAAREMKGISMRINEAKKRQEIMAQMEQQQRAKRKESDLRIGFPKAFGRRTEKLKQQVGISDMYEDKAYTAVNQKYGEHYFRVQIAMRDLEMYTSDAEVFLKRFYSFAEAMEQHIEVAQTSYPEVESKWRKFRMMVTDLQTVALPDHLAAVRKNVIDPLVTLLSLHTTPQKLMQKRTKKLPDYARFRAIKDRGDKPDKKTTEQAEQFTAINDTLKDELPKLFALTHKLMGSCLDNFIQLQVKWTLLWRHKLSQSLDDAQMPRNPQDVIDSFTGDFAFFDAQVTSLSICNGSMINDYISPNLLSASTTLNGDEVASSRYASSIDSKRRTMSISSDKSPQLPQPDFGGRTSGNFLSGAEATQLPSGLHRLPSGRVRASSTLSGHGPRTPEASGQYRSHANTMNSTPTTTPAYQRPNTASHRTNTEPYPSIRPSLDKATVSRLSDDMTLQHNYRTSGQSYGPTSQPRSSSPVRFSGAFSSAMPMADSPTEHSPTTGPMQSLGFKVIFLAASVYEFNIDKARKEAGYPYLTYVAGEIFDVVGEKGELWLAKNQDDAGNLVGWIWNKHFVKLAS